MSLAMLLYPPPTDRGPEEWSYHNLQHHQAVSDAIYAQRGVRVTATNIYPMRGDNLMSWARAHQEWHDAINGILGVPGVDLQNVDWEQREEIDAFFWLHFNQHRAWAQTLGGQL